MLTVRGSPAHSHARGWWLITTMCVWLPVHQCAPWDGNSVVVLQRDHLRLVNMTDTYSTTAPGAPAQPTVYHTVDITPHGEGRVVAVDVVNHVVYWSGSTPSNHLMKYTIGTDDMTEYVTSGFYMSLMVHDHVHNNLYYVPSTDTTVVWVRSMVTHKTAPVYKAADGYTVIDVDVDPRAAHRWLYVTQVGRSDVQVAQCGLEGRHCTTITRNNDFQPHAITIDYNQNLAYMIQADTYITYDLTSKSFISTLSLPAGARYAGGLALYSQPQAQGQSYLLWSYSVGANLNIQTVEVGQSVSIADRFTGFYGGYSRIQDLAVIPAGSSIAAEDDACRTNRCGHVCIAVNSSGQPAEPRDYVCLNEVGEVVPEDDFESTSVASDHTSPSSTPATSDLLVIRSMHPTYGPVAGGTTISIVIEWTGRGNYMNPTVWLADTHTQLCEQLLIVGASTWLCTTAQWTGTDDVINTKQPLTVRWEADSGETTGGATTTTHTYQYRRNPEVSSVHPLETIIDGGIPLTVSGVDMDGSPDPKLVSTVTTPSHNYIDITDCSVRDATSMICTTPALNVPEGTTLDEADECQQQEGSLTLCSDTVRVSIGFTFDHHYEYADLSTVPHLQGYSLLHTRNSPQIPALHSTVVIKTWWPNTPPHALHIKGSSLDALKDQYIVTVGDSYCDVITHEKSLITCKPPRSEPYPQSQGRKHPLRVSLGAANFTPYHVRYENSILDCDGCTVGMGVGVGCVGLLVLVSAGIAVKKCLNKREKGSASHKARATSSPAAANPANGYDSTRHSQSQIHPHIDDTSMTAPVGVYQPAPNYHQSDTAPPAPPPDNIYTAPSTLDMYKELDRAAAGGPYRDLYVAPYHQHQLQEDQRQPDGNSTTHKHPPPPPPPSSAPASSHIYSVIDDYSIYSGSEPYSEAYSYYTSSSVARPKPSRYLHPPTRHTASTTIPTNQ